MNDACSYVEVNNQLQFTNLASSIKYHSRAEKSVLIQFVSSVEGEGVIEASKYFIEQLVALNMGPILVIDCINKLDSDYNSRGEVISLTTAQNKNIPIDRAVRISNSEPLISNAFLLNNKQSWKDFYKCDVVEIFSEAMKLYRFIILNCPAVCVVPESTNIAMNCDGTILIVSADTTPKYLIHRAKSMIDNSGGNLVGVIFNQNESYIPKILKSFFVV